MEELPNRVYAEDVTLSKDAVIIKQGETTLC
jgi:hypothetical protein